ncbi:MAG: DUF1461 domain-containing protein, partial [Clostridia bacterium]|nr:DUF1461 domain-containing protein [Clostridia bacterium]
DMKKRIIHFLDVLLWPVIALIVILSFVEDVGLDRHLYFEEQLKAGVVETAGISEDDLWKLDTRLLMCLLGEDDWNEEWDLQDGGEPLNVVVNGVQQIAFNEREVQHLLDCQRLFHLLSVTQIALMIAIVVLVIFSKILPRIWKIKSELTPKHLWIGSAVIIAPFAILAIWAAIDFSSAFNFFHRLLFTNDLWLLNPETDLLIRICPQSMFANMGLRIALLSAAVLLGLPLVVTILSLIFKKRKKDTNEIPQI